MGKCWIGYLRLYDQFTNLEDKPLNKVVKKTFGLGFPGGTVVKNPSANAGAHGFERRSGKIPHAAERLSPCATTTEAPAPRARAPQQEATEMRSPRTTMKSSLRSPQLEKAHAQQRRPNTANNKYIK